LTSLEQMQSIRKRIVDCLADIECFGKIDVVFA